MRKADSNERVRCPDSNEVLEPSDCWDTVNPKGERETRGIFKEHDHTASRCPWSGLPAPEPVFPAASPKEPEPPKKDTPSVGWI